MITKKINGYTIEVAYSRINERFRFVTLVDEQGQRHYFNMDKSGEGQWVIRNPATVTPFIVEIEKELAELI